MVSAYPVFGERWVLRQPDGGVVEARIWGDEYYQVVESLDGYTLIRDPSTLVICYARLSGDGNELVSTGIRVGKVDAASLGVKKHVRINGEARARLVQESRNAWEPRRASRETGAEGTPTLASGPIIGDVQGLVILVDFEDQSATIPRDDIDGMFNEIGYTGHGNNGSVRDYFHDVSIGMLNYTNWVTPTYYRAQYPFAHYDDCSKPWPEGPFELIVEVLDYLEASGLDFEQFDADGDGFIDAFAMMYAGNTHCGWAKGMWAGGGGIDSLWVSASGVATGRGQWIGTASTPGIGGFCHESGHSICHWPDLYDYHGDSEGIGRYCLMANFASRTNPVQPCAYLKYTAGWGAVTTLTTSEQGLIVPASSTNTMFKYEHPALISEYFLVENRRQIGRDAEIPDHGLAVWHIDTNGWNSWNEMLPDQHYMVTLVQADGRWDMEKNVNEGDSTDLYGAPAATALTPNTNPSSGWWDGSQSDLWIENISESQLSMTFDFNINVPATISVGDVATISRNKSVWVFSVDLENAGPSDAYKVIGEITESLPWTTVRKASCKYDDISVGNDERSRGVYLLASDLKSWPDESFFADLYLRWENQWGSVFADTLTLAFHPSGDVSCVAHNVPAGETHQKAERRLFSVSRGEDAAEVGIDVGAYATGLQRNYPNPFNPSTTIPFTLACQERVFLGIYDAGGRLIRNLMDEVMPEGRHDVTWDGRDNAGNQAATGVYFVQLRAGSYGATIKMALIK